MIRDFIEGLDVSEKIKDSIVYFGRHPGKYFNDYIRNGYDGSSYFLLQLGLYLPKYDSLYSY
jgi:hypothetical protein